MMPPRIDGFRTCQSRSADLVTVTKSEPKNTRSTPTTANSLFARGEGAAASAVAKSIVPFSMTTRPGRNFRVDGLGVCSVWMNKPTSVSDASRNRWRRAGWERDVSAPQLDGLDVGTAAKPIKSILGRDWKCIMDNINIIHIYQSTKIL